MKLDGSITRAMFRCIECGKNQQKQLFVKYDNSYNVKLEKCSDCLQFLDKYIEYDFILIIKLELTQNRVNFMDTDRLFKFFCG